MGLRKAILEIMLSSYKSDGDLRAAWAGLTWEDAAFLRSCLRRLELDDVQGWNDFVNRLTDDSRFGRVVQAFLEYSDITSENVIFLQSCLARYEQGNADAAWDELVERLNKDSWFCRAVETLLDAGDVHSQDLDPILEILRLTCALRPGSTASPVRTKKPKAEVMYIERKAGRLIGEARIGRVCFSRTGKTLHYNGKQFRSLKGRGFKSNYVDLSTGEEYWISGPRRDGQDRLNGERLPVEIDEDVREEYWTAIRQQPENVHRKTV